MQQNKNLIQLGKKLRESRESIGLSVRHVSKLLNASFGNVAKLERGEYSRPPIKMLQGMCEIYGLEADEIIVQAEKIPPDVYWRIIRNPSLLNVIRSYEV